MNLYAESSAVLAWIMGEDSGERVREELSGAELVLAADLTVIECDRVLHRAVALGDLTEEEGTARRAVLNGAAQAWNLLRLSEPVVERARRPFPLEPVRSLDAIHLASVTVVAESVTPVVVLSLDERVRHNARALGFEVRPSSAADDLLMDDG